MLAKCVSEKPQINWMFHANIISRQMGWILKALPLMFKERFNPRTVKLHFLRGLKGKKQKYFTAYLLKN